MKLLLTVSLMLCVYVVLACDWCGCSSGSNGIGVLPGIKKSFVSLRTSASYSKAFSEHGNSEDVQKPHSQEQTLTTELWGRWNIKNRVQLFAFLPYTINTRSEPTITETFHGLGDAMILTNVVLFNTADSIGKKVKHHIMAGGGIKLPTGKFGKQSADGLLIPNMQTGSGTVDFLVNAIYTIRIRNWGVQTDAAYRFNLENKKYSYHFGNKANVGLRTYYWAMVNKTMLMPYAGFTGEHAAPDTRFDMIKQRTGGYALQSNVGMQVFVGKFGMGGSWSAPLASNYAKGWVQTGHRWSAQLQYFF
jgi:hypothetical protein